MNWTFIEERPEINLNISKIYFIAGRWVGYELCLWFKQNKQCDCRWFRSSRRDVRWLHALLSCLATWSLQEFDRRVIHPGIPDIGKSAVSSDVVSVNDDTNYVKGFGIYYTVFHFDCLTSSDILRTMFCSICFCCSFVIQRQNKLVLVFSASCLTWVACWKLNDDPLETDAAFCATSTDKRKMKFKLVPCAVVRTASYKNVCDVIL